MLIRDKKHFAVGLIMAIGFFAVLAYMFTPSFNKSTTGGENAFNASDRLFNTIAKGSTNYFPHLLDVAKTADKDVAVTVLAKDKDFAELATVILTRHGISVTPGEGLDVKGNLKVMLEAALADSQLMFDNNGQALADEYELPSALVEKAAAELKARGKEMSLVDVEAKLVVRTWGALFKSMETSFKKIKMVEEATLVHDIMTKGVEVGYNFYGIAPESASNKAGILSFALIFYVIYTLWWGFAIFYLFEGFGLAMTKGSKKEV